MNKTRLFHSLVGLCLLCTGAWAQTASPPTRQPDNLIVAAYNIKFFKMPSQDLGRLAEVIQHFDVCGVQELQDEKEMASLRAALETKSGEKWGYVYSCYTKETPSISYREAYGVLYRRDRVELGDGLVGTLWDPESKIRNDPYMVSFRAKNFDFVYVLMHTRFNEGATGSRDTELAALGPLLAKKRKELPEKDIILAGDFNHPGTQESMKKMADAAGMSQLDEDPKTTLGGGPYDHFYATRNLTTEFVPGSCQALDVTTLIYGSISPTTLQQSKSHLSDHLPIFAVFNTDGVDDD